MGYNTEFRGELKFTNELTASQLAYLQSFLEEDCRDHTDWISSKGLTWVELQLLSDFSGLKWNGAEKSYNMVEIVNMIIINMREIMPDFGLEGKFLAQGEDIDDRWELIFENGFAIEKKVPQTGSKIICPHCKQHFYI